MNQERIGTAAGIVWTQLNKNPEGVTLNALKKIKGLTADEVVAAVGWLAREGKLAFTSEKKKTLIALNGSVVHV